MSGSCVQMISSLLGFNVGTLPFTYLWCPIFRGKLSKVSHFQMITNRIKIKLSTWKGTSLSIVGRLQLVKSIIHGMLVSSFQVYLWPRRLIRSLDTWIKKFIWSGDVIT